MTYHPAIQLYDYATTTGRIFEGIQASYGTLDAYYGLGTFNMNQAKALLASNAKSAARALIEEHASERNVEHYRQTFRSRDVQDACASILLYDYMREKQRAEKRN